MPGIIVSRPIFNTLFKLAHEEGLSINAFLTSLLENAGTDAVKQAASRPEAPGSSSPGSSEPRVIPEYQGAASNLEIAGSELSEGEPGSSPTVRQHTVRPIEYEDDLELAGPGPGPGERVPGRRIGNSIWDKVVSMEGRKFATSRGKKFSYKVTGGYIVVRDSQARIPRSQFDKAQKMWPVTGPSRLVGVYAPSVVWAVMNELTEAEEPAAV